MSVHDKYDAFLRSKITLVPGSGMENAITVEQAAELLGLHVVTIRTYVRDGLLAPIPGTGGRGRKAYFAPSDVEAVRGRQLQREERQRQYREAILAAGRRVCTGPCGRDLPLESYEYHPLGIGQRHARCPDCRREDARLFAQKNRESRIAYKREYRQREREKVRAAKRDYQKRITAEKGPQWANLRGYFRKWYRVEQAIEDGKRSAICRRFGFSLVLDSEGQYFPRRLDKPILDGERAVVYFTYFASDGISRWVTNAPPLRTPDQATTDRLLRSAVSAAPARGRRKKQVVANAS